MLTELLLIGAAFLAGVQNALAGGGSFLTFPALVYAGVPSVAANASSTVALLPGTLASAWGYRHDLKPFEGVGLPALLGVSVAGGGAGAFLLLVTPQHYFDAVVPWLLGAATLLFACGPRLTPWLQRRWRIGPYTLLFVQFLIAVYGGYFGGAVSIMMLALYGLFGLTDLYAMNATKTLMNGLLNAIAVGIFIVAGEIWWAEVLPMMVASTAGGYAGARLGRRIDKRILRVGIIVLGVFLTIAFFRR